MDANKDQKLKEYAGGWMTERQGTEVPGFLKLAFPIIAFSCTAYLVIYMYGEVTHSERGRLVQQFNQVSETSAGLMYAVAALALVFAVVVVKFAFSKSHE
jgi:hypothetical protein